MGYQFSSTPMVRNATMKIITLKPGYGFNHFRQHLWCERQKVKLITFNRQCSPSTTKKKRIHSDSEVAWPEALRWHSLLHN